MINKDSIDIYNYTFPILKSEELINNDNNIFINFIYDKINSI